MWIKIAQNLTKEEAKEYLSIVQSQQLRNERRDARYSKAELENGVWNVYKTESFADLSDDEVKHYVNVGMVNGY